GMVGIEAILAATPAPLASVRDGLPPRLCALVDRCLAADPGDRPQSGAALRAELEAVLAETAPVGPREIAAYLGRFVRATTSERESSAPGTADAAPAAPAARGTQTLH